MSSSPNNAASPKIDQSLRMQMVKDYMHLVCKIAESAVSAPRGSAISSEMRLLSLAAFVEFVQKYDPKINGRFRASAELSCATELVAELKRRKLSVPSRLVALVKPAPSGIKQVYGDKEAKVASDRLASRVLLHLRSGSAEWQNLWTEISQRQLISDAQQCIQFLSAGISRLSPGERAIVRLVYGCGVHGDTVASLLGDNTVSAGGVAVRLIAELRNILAA